MALLARVTLPDVSGIVKDEAQNSFVFDAPNAPASYTAIDAAILSFYTSIAPGATLSLDKYIGASRTRAALACLVETYDITGHLDGTPHGSPVHALAFTLGAQPVASDLPDQCAAVLSYHADLSSVFEHGPTHVVNTPDEAQDFGAPATAVVKSRPRASRRGRIWIGPVSQQGIAGNGDVSAQFGVDLCKAAAKLLSDSAAGVIPWSVWSRIAAGALYHVTSGWCDSRFGTQRRRRDFATQRSLWP